MVKNKKVNKKQIRNVAKRIKGVQSVDDTTNLIKKFLILCAIAIVIVVGMYFVSAKVVDSRDETQNNTAAEGKIDYSVTNVGGILNRPYDEYYVIVYNSGDSEALYYSSLITKYQSVEGSKKIYYCDLANEFNNDYAAEESQLNVKDVSEFKFGKISLLLINSGKVAKSYDSYEVIKEILK